MKWYDFRKNPKSMPFSNSSQFAVFKTPFEAIDRILEA
jgi:hypothetical protein